MKYFTRRGYTVEEGFRLVLAQSEAARKAENKLLELDEDRRLLGLPWDREDANPVQDIKEAMKSLSEMKPPTQEAQDHLADVVSKAAEEAREKRHQRQRGQQQRTKEAQARAAHRREQEGVQPLPGVDTPVPPSWDKDWGNLPGVWDAQPPEGFDRADGSTRNFTKLPTGSTGVGPGATGGGPTGPAPEHSTGSLCWWEVTKTWQDCKRANYDPEEIGDILYTLIQELIEGKVPE